MTKDEELIYVLRHCVRPPDLDKLLNDAAKEIERLSDLLTEREKENG